MEKYNDIGMLDLITRPAFCAAQGCVTRVSSRAAAFDITPGMKVSELLATGEEEYAAFTGGCLHLVLSVGKQKLSASVTRMDGFDVFCFEESEDSRELQAMALAARELRAPLDTIMLTARQLFPLTGLENDPAAREQAARLNRGLYQILRVINNMSDADQAPTAARMETVNIPAVFREIISKAAAMVAHTGLELNYEGYPEAVHGLADRDCLERAVLNMLSNAIRFSPPGETIRAVLTRRGKKFYLTVENNGDPIPTDIRSDVFTRYQRGCSMEDTRFGLGLGLVLIRTAAAAHGGTVLVKSSRHTGTKVTMSLAIRQGQGQVQSNIMKVDYTGGMDPCLIELSKCLPESLYEQEL